MQVTLAEAMADGVDLARDAWRRLWAVQILTALGVAAGFVALRGAVDPREASDLLGAGAILTLAMAAPLWGGLYRAAEGLESNGLAGLRVGPDELRLLGLGAAFLLAATLGWLPLVALSAAIFVLFHDAGQVVLGALGGVQVSFLIVAAVWAAGFGVFVYVCGRMAVAPAASVAEGRLVVLDAWEASRGRAGAALLALALCQGPTLLLLSLLGLADSFQLQHLVVGTGLRWPLLDASLAGAGLGVVLAFVQVPMTAGALSRLNRRALPLVHVSNAAIRRALKAELSPG